MCDNVLGDDDLLTEILLRLPVKDLLRCKCVCKKWMSLISEPQFCYRHTLRLCRKNPNPNTNPYLYPSGMLFQESIDCVRNKKGYVVSFTDNSNNRFIHLNAHTNFEGTLNYRLLRSCNGLQLWDSTPIRPWPSPTNDAEANKILQRCSFFYVSNPSTGRCVRIDRFGFAFHPGFSSAFLVFEPWISPHYKVIFFEITSKRKVKMSVYSSEKGSWSKHDLLSPLPPDLFRFPRPGVYCNGSIHWFDLGDNFVNSLYFDIDRLCFKDLPVLPITHGVLPYDQLQVMHFGESGGNLYLIMARSTVLLKYDIWELKEDYSRWILKYNVDATKNNLVHNWCIDVTPLRVVRQPPNEDGEEESIFAILIVDHRKLVSYNLKDHSWKILHQADRFSPPYFKDQYFDTLANDDENSVYFDTNRLCFDKLPASPVSVDSNSELPCVKYFGECMQREATLDAN
ncbi:hypothetical protein PIB30_070947 [Stylosanthes scabra]|uniref:F-box domain-containing protein n=1 Tax=Stylosanthes scabra TaxID=79078 RepID=A0ABU6QP21_9FABA|nr:hypothetical protein [Stylosanthes scabra]